LPIHWGEPLIDSRLKAIQFLSFLHGVANFPTLADQFHASAVNLTPGFLFSYLAQGTAKEIPSNLFRRQVSREGFASQLVCQGHIEPDSEVHRDAPLDLRLRLW
jgi:hypothetical protein